MVIAPAPGPAGCGPPPRTAVEEVAIDHRRCHVLVAQEFLDRPDVVTVLQEVGGEGMPEGLAGRGFVMPPSRTACFTARCSTHTCIRGVAETSELDDRVLAVAHVDGVDEADHAPDVRHQHGARPDAAAVGAAIDVQGVGRLRPARLDRQVPGAEVAAARIEAREDARAETRDPEVAI